MKLFPGEFFQGIPVGLEHIHALVHSFDFLFVLAYLSFLTLDLHSGLSPMNPGISRADKPDEHKDSRTESNKNPEILVLTLKYVAELTQNRTD